jgi:hypothetical protein
LMARQGRLRMPPKGQAPERQNEKRTNQNDFDDNTHIPPPFMQAQYRVPKPRVT